MGLPKTPQERIKADAERYTKDEGYQKAYIAGATAENEMAQKMAEALEQISGQHGQLIPPKHEMIAIAREAIKQWNAGKAVELSCMVCGTKFMGPEPKTCCSGRDCGCMGLPVEPIVCSKECYEKGVQPQNVNSGVPVIIDPCPHCGKELNRDRNLCCRECGKEVAG